MLRKWVSVAGVPKQNRYLWRLTTGVAAADNHPWRPARPRHSDLGHVILSIAKNLGAAVGVLHCVQNDRVLSALEEELLCFVS